MKKEFILLLVVLLAWSLTACSIRPSSTHATSPPATELIDIYTLFSDPISKEISIYGPSELETMRAMAVSTDTEAVAKYLRTIRGGAETQADLVNFLRLYDALPKANLLDGEICWIKLSVDAEKSSAYFYIAVEAENGDWVRTEYNLTVTDVDAALGALQTSDFAVELLQTPISAANGRIQLYSESQKTTVGTPGVTANWRMTIDGIYGFIFYHSDSTESITAAEVFANASVY